MKKTLDRIEIDIANGLKLKAVDRLRNLINEYPNDLSLRDKLADLYYNSGFLDAAGRYWILFEPNDNRKRKSIEAYEKTVNKSGYQILQDITFRGDKDKLPEYARKKILELESDSKEKVNYVPYSKTNQKNKNYRDKKRELSFQDSLVFLLSIGTIILVVTLIIIGLIRVIQWII
jgi:hypothetical protein